MKRIVFAGFLAVLAPLAAAGATPIGQVLLHAPMDGFFSCIEHHEGQFKHLGDALGTDCLAQDFVEEDGRLWARSYAGDGLRNEDWFGWHKQLLAPCDCEVVRLRENTVQNSPGILGRPPAASIIFKRADGVHIVYAHMREPLVKVGDKVTAGQPVAMIGNNGYSRSPHVHVGAWKDKTPLQVRWDQRRDEEVVSDADKLR